MKHSLNCALLLIALQLFILCRISAVDDGICRPMKCNGRNTSLAGYQKKCRCDVECEMYGDCCIDSPYKPQTYIQSFFECVDVKYRSAAVYIKRNCNRFNTIRQYSYRKHCMKSRNYEDQIANYTYKLPVTLSNGITYGNKYCTMCDNVDSNYTTWLARFTCDSGSHVSEINITKLDSNSTKFFYNNTLNKWTYVDGNTTETCEFSPIPPQSLRGRDKLRRCLSNMVKSCPSSSNLYNDKCLDYMSTVQDKNGTYYKNEYCALCNNVSSSNLMCRRKRNSTRTSTPVSSAATSVSSTTAMLTPATFPRIFLSTTPSTSPATPVSNNTNSTIQVREFLHITVKHNCKDLLESLSLMKLVVETKSFTTMKRSYIKESNLISSFPVRICKEYDTEESDSEPEDRAMLKIIVNSAIAVSILFTSMHLYDFMFSNSISTSTQRNFALYGICLIIANFGFFFGDITDLYCHFLGPITYFGFLTSLFWISALSFDIACETWRCVQENSAFGRNDIDSSKKSRKYSLITWIFPAVVAVITTYRAGMSGEFLMTTIYELCWFPDTKGFTTFFVLPLIVTVSVNFAFWLFSAYVVWAQRTVVGKLFAEHGIDFKFHTGLIITSNLMWSTALYGLFNENFFIWLCFAGLNATLGLLVYLCSPVKHAFAIKLTTYLDKRFLSIDEKETSK